MIDLEYSYEKVSQSRLAAAHGIEYQLRKMHELERREAEMFNLRDSDKGVSQNFHSIHNMSITQYDTLENAPAEAFETAAYPYSFKDTWAEFENNIWALTDGVKQDLDAGVIALMHEFKESARRQLRVDGEVDALGSALVTSGQERINGLEDEKKKLLEDQKKLKENMARLKEELTQAKADLQGFRDALAPLQKLA